MRTLRVELESPVGDAGSGLFGSAVPKLRISTEVIVDDSDAHSAGREACSTLNDFIAGYVAELES